MNYENGESTGAMEEEVPLIRLFLRCLWLIGFVSLPDAILMYTICYCELGWLGSRVVSVLDSGAEKPRFKSQSRRCRVTVLGILFTPIVPLFTKQQNW